jgi:spore coat polysaccharide biosynthesis protein SpsF (cytidylyltransferase family)
MWRKVDYASNCHQDRTFPKGLDCEVFTYDTLEYTYVTVKDRYKEVSQLLEGPKPKDFEVDQKRCLYDMEHVTPFMIRNPDIKKALVKCLAGDFSSKNWCVDFPSDIQKIEKIIGQAKKAIEKKAVIIPATVSESNVLH